MPFLLSSERIKSFRFVPGKINFLKENSRFPEFSEKWKKGVCIFHDDYGYGQIVETDSSSDDYVIRVRFQNGGIKTFMPAFQAKSLQIVKDEYVF